MSSLAKFGLGNKNPAVKGTVGLVTNTGSLNNTLLMFLMKFLNHYALHNIHWGFQSYNRNGFLAFSSPLFGVTLRVVTGFYFIPTLKAIQAKENALGYGLDSSDELWLSTHAPNNASLNWRPEIPLPLSPRPNPRGWIYPPPVSL